MFKSILKNIYFKNQNIRYSETNLLQARFFHFASNNIIVYDDPLNSKINILQDNKQKCGVYK